MMLQVTSVHGNTIWINEDKIEMIEPSRAQGVGSIIHIEGGRTVEVRETPVEVLSMTRE